MTNIIKTFDLIPQKRAKKIPLIVLAMIIGAGFEVLGVGIIIPVVSLIVTDIEQSWITNISYLQTKTREQLLQLFLVFFALLYISKGLYLALLARYLGNYTYKTKAEMTDEIMQKYLNQRYEFHLNKNSAVLIRNLTTEMAGFVGYALTPLLVIASEGLVIAFIASFLFFIEPLGTLVTISGILILALSFQKALSRHSRKLGQTRQVADGQLLRSAQEALGGIRDVKLQHKEDIFAAEFSRHNQESCTVSGKQFFVSQLPRLYLETIGVLAMLVLLFLQAMRQEDLSQVVPMFAAFGFAAFKLLPSSNRLLGSFNSLQFAAPIITTLSQELEGFPKPSSSLAKAPHSTDVINFKTSIELKNISYRYPKAPEKSINNVSLKILRGESVGIVGKSGAGKSTLSDIILGLLQPLDGNIYVDNEDVYADLSSWQKQIGYVQQNIYLLDDSIVNNITFGEDSGKINYSRLSEVIENSQLSELVETLPDGLNTNLGERGVRLSGGQKQRIGIARALYRNCSVLIFDEATSSLDNETEAEIVASIKNLKRDKTIIVIAHRLSTIEHCDKVIEMQNGRIIKCTSSIDAK